MTRKRRGQTRSRAVESKGNPRSRTRRPFPSPVISFPSGRSVRRDTRDIDVPVFTVSVRTRCAKFVRAVKLMLHLHAVQYIRVTRIQIYRLNEERPVTRTMPPWPHHHRHAWGKQKGAKDLSAPQTGASIYIYTDMYICIDVPNICICECELALSHAHARARARVIAHFVSVYNKVIGVDGTGGQTVDFSVTGISIFFG